jgi:hypothetical protein
MKRSIRLLSALLLLPVLAAASTVPDLNHSTVAVYYHGPMSICVVPGGGGDLLSEARTLDGTPVDATIHVWIVDGGADPIYGFPWEDIWLESTAGSLAPCYPLGVMADAATDLQGYTAFSGALSAGGHSAPGEKLQVYIAGTPVACCDLDIRFNSPDVDGNGVVDLTDLVLFSQAYTGGAYDYAGDLFADGVLNLSDVQVFATHYAASCD